MPANLIIIIIINDNVNVSCKKECKKENNLLTYVQKTKNEK